MSGGSTPVAAGKRSPREYLRQSLLTGTAIIVPVLVTAVILLFAVDVLTGLLAPLVIPIEQALGTGGSTILPTLVAVVFLLVTILAVGALNESSYGGNRLKGGLDATMSRIPGIGSIYGTLDQISELLLESDTENFEEVVLVEYPTEGSYSVAFLTADTPEVIETATAGEDMITVFMPMGPNPVMGGFILHVEPERVHDVDLSVEEGITEIVSFGVAVESEEHDPTRAGHLDDFGAGT